MLRDFLVGLSLMVFATGAFAADSSALTGKTLIDGESVTVGDLFTNAGRHAEYVLAPTPKVGDKLNLTKTDLQRVAETFHLNWTAPAEDVIVSLQRNAVEVDAQKIAEALGKSDLKKDISDDAAFQVTNLQQSLVFPGLEEPNIVVSDGSFEAGSEQFTAHVKIIRGDITLKELTVKGNATPMITVPVLRHMVSSNVALRADDLNLVSIPRRDMRSGSFMTIADAVGMTPKRNMAAGQTIATADVTPPVLIKRNDLITVTYQNGPVRLSTKARALADGSKGESVMLENASSKKSFSAKVTGPEQAEVLLDTSVNG